MKYLFLIIFIVLTITQSRAQNFDFGKVSKTELEEKSHPKQVSADAAILYRNEKINFRFDNNEGFVQEREIHERIKIYSKEGLNWATKKVYLYQGKGGKKESLINLRAFTYNLANGKIEKNKLKNDGKFQEDYNDFTSITSFTMPNIKVGSVIEYNYTVKSPYSSIDDVILQSSIPINKLNVYISTPQYFQYNVTGNLKAFYIPKVSKRIQNRRVTITDVGSLNAGFRREGMSQSESEYEEDIIEIDESNVPPLEKEPHAGSLKKYIAKLSFELSAYLDQDRVIKKSFSSSWEKVTETIYQRDNFGPQLKKTNFFAEELDNIFDNQMDEINKVFFIQEYVKSKVRWNGVNGIYTQKGVRKAYKEGAGNVSDINLLLVSMLRYKGLNANPVLVSTKENGIPLFPTREGFNYVVCMVEVNGKKALLDATEKYNAINILPYRALNWKGRLIKQDGTSSWVNLNPTFRSSENTVLNAVIDETFAVTGNVNKSYTGYLAKDYRVKFNDLDLDGKIRMHESGKDNLEITAYKYDNKDEITKPVIIGYEFNMDDSLDTLDDKLIFSPLLILAQDENPFKLDTRQYPIDFVLPYRDKYIVNIQIPDGYEINSLPKNEVVTYNEGQLSYKYLIKNNGNFITLNFSFEIKNPVVNATDYTELKHFFSKFIEKQAEQVILTKA
jgi:transglutaminase-like putative cysteine protease